MTGQLIFNLFVNSPELLIYLILVGSFLIVIRTIKEKAP